MATHSKSKVHGHEIGFTPSHLRGRQRVQKMLRETKAYDAIIEEQRAIESRNSNAVSHKELTAYYGRSTKKVNITFD